MRITEKALNHIAGLLNGVTKSPLTTHKKRRKNGVYERNIGHYMIDCAYGGYKLVRVTNASGAVRDISSGGYIIAGQLYDQINGMINVIIETKRK